MAEKPPKKGKIPMKKFVVISIAVLLLIVALTFLVNSFKPAAPEIDSLALPSKSVIVRPDPVIITESIRELGCLETASISFKREYWGERDQELVWGLFGEKMLFICFGQVVAGVDFQKISKVEIVDDTTVRVYLPEAEIFNVSIDNQKSYVTYRFIGPFTTADYELESQVRMQAQQDIEVCARQAGILVKAQINAESELRNFLFKFGYHTVEFPAVQMN